MTAPKPNDEAAASSPKLLVADGRNSPSGVENVIAGIGEGIQLDGVACYSFDHLDGLVAQIRAQFTDAEKPSVATS